MTTPPGERKALGNRGEDAAAAFLERRGFVILERQWHCRFGELDLVARDCAGTVHFVEVKLRRSRSVALPREAVGYRKQAKLRAAASLWLSRYAPDAPARFDVAELFAPSGGPLRIRYLEDAFY